MDTATGNSHHTLPHRRTVPSSPSCILYSVFCIVLPACTEKPAPRGTNQLELRPCHVSTPGITRRLAARCGWVPVPEDWSRPGGRKIRLHVAVLPASSEHPEPDPLLFFAGGPGHAAGESFLPVAAGFSRLRRKRDVVLVDQRGTGRSHPLRCEPPKSANPYQEIPPEQQQQWLQRCIKSLSPGSDLRLYTTGAALRDFDHVRKQLGYRRVNLYGVSYGTRVALSYLRRHEEQVRSVVLDGVLPQDAVLGPDVMTEGPARVLRLMLARCRKDPACHKRFPDLASEVQKLEQRLQRDPPEASIIHPRTGRPVQTRLTWENWALTLRLLGYSSETVALLPLLLHTAYQRQDHTLLMSQAVVIGDMLRRSINSGLEASVLCTEDWPFFPTEESAISKARYGRRELQSVARLCKLWPHRPVGASFKKAVVSNVPVLLLSGEMDPVTPPVGATRAARTLSQSLHLVVPGQGHGVVMRGCMPELVARFIKTASTRGLDAACLQRIKPLGFFTSFTGPEP